MFARTERLLLRPAWAEDAPALFEGINDQGIVRNLASAPWPYSLDDAAKFVATPRSPREPALLIFLRTQAAPRLVGSIGLARTGCGATEIGYWVARPWWGHGFASEAGQAVIAIARHGLRLDRLVAGHFLDNPASGRVLRKLGFRPTGAIRARHSAGRGEDVPSAEFELDLLDSAVTCPPDPCDMLAA